MQTPRILSTSLMFSVIAAGCLHEADIAESNTIAGAAGTPTPPGSAGGSSAAGGAGGTEGSSATGGTGGAELGTPLTLRYDECESSDLGPGNERIDWGGTDCGVIAVENLRIRCGQTPCAFVKSDGETAKVLIRPCDMDPDPISQCSCVFRKIEFDAPDSAKTVEISRQGDNVGGAKPPTLIGSAQCVPTD